MSLKQRLPLELVRHQQDLEAGLKTLGVVSCTSTCSASRSHCSLSHGYLALRSTVAAQPGWNPSHLSEYSLIVIFLLNIEKSLLETLSSDVTATIILVSLSFVFSVVCEWYLNTEQGFHPYFPQWPSPPLHSAVLTGLQDLCNFFLTLLILNSWPVSEVPSQPIFC